MVQHFRSLLRARNDDGASTLEYGLLIAAIVVLIVLIVFALHRVINEVFEDPCAAGGTASTSQNC